MKSTTASEIEIQQSFRKRLYYGAPQVRVVAIPNAARRTQWEVSRARKEGLATGFPDVMCIWPGGGVAYIEFKAAKGRLTESQAEWQVLLRRYGFPVTVARSADDAITFLRECGAPVMERAG